MTESLLHYLWKHNLYRFSGLQTTQGEHVKVIHPGFAHQNAGPDFQQAVIKIGEITWAGDVEIHLLSSDWIKHKHQNDPKYQSVILHVVYESDMEIDRTETEVYPTLALREYVSPLLLEEYLKLSLSENKLPCSAQLVHFPIHMFASVFSSLLFERLQEKRRMVMSMLEECKGDWEEVFYRLLMIGFGFKTNIAAFELLGKSLPYRLIRKHSGVKAQIYALLFGQAGMLQEDNPSDLYYHQLYEEYQYLKYKYRLNSIHLKNWNYLRLRPVNFPTIRLAQLSELLATVPDLFVHLLELKEVEQIDTLFECSPHPYWRTHTHFGKVSAEKSATLGKHSRELLIINVIVPVFFAYSLFMGDVTLQARSVALLEMLPPEMNYITKRYISSGFPLEKASHSQAILTLEKQYCIEKRCLDCEIGSWLLKRTYQEGQ